MTPPDDCTLADFQYELPDAGLDETSLYCDPESNTYDSIDCETGESIMTEAANSRVITVENPTT